MVITMQGVNKFFSHSTVGYKMKKKPMRQVFKKSPEKHAAQKSKNDPSGWKSKTIAAVIQHIDHHRQVHAPDNEGMCFGQHFQVRIPEKLCLTFVMNFFEFHDAKIRKGMCVQNREKT